MPHNILIIDSSPSGERSISRRLTAKVVAELKARRPDSAVVERDLVADPFPHLDGMTIGAFYTPPEQRNALMTEAIRRSDAAVDEVLAADVIVVGAPMHNFGVPSGLKAWVDHIVRPGRTFKYGASGPEGLIPSGKKTIVVSARGGVFTEGAAKALDFQEHYLETLFSFVGLNDVSFVRAEGVAMGQEAASAAISAAEAQAVALVRELA
jgi:FMN-dependent NADH-azoreductase